MKRADYVIVGAGAAGPILAARLSENSAVNVVLLEAGKENTYEAGRIQGAFFNLFGGEADWAYHTVSQPGLNGRQIYEPRGKVMGGSTAINVGAWLRGCQADYDGWAAAGATGWDFKAALEIFRRVEHTDRGPSEWRGGDGPIRMADLPSPTSLADTLLQGFVQAGYGPRGDTAGPTPYAADRIQTIFPDRYRRTPADAYLDDTVRARPNLTVITGAFVTRILFEGTRATGVVYRQEGVEHELPAREVVLSAGAINTPQLLMLSGVGPAQHLREHGLPVVADVPGVGENLQGHLCARLRVLSAAGVEGSYPARSDEDAIAQWRTNRTGPAAYWPENGVGFITTEPHAAGPDFELVFQYNPDLGDGTLFEGATGADQRTGYTVGAILLQPRSRGVIRLASANPDDHPVIDPRFLSHPDDLPAFVRGLRAAQRITQSPALAPYTDQMYPALDAGDQEFEQFVRAEAASVFHPVGTAKMGDLADPLTVVDPQLRVRGMEGLRIADASVFPTIIRGHTMAPTVVVGERAAELIRARNGR